MFLWDSIFDDLCYSIFGPKRVVWKRDCNCHVVHFKILVAYIYHLMLNTKQAGSEPHYLSSKDSGNLTLLSMSVCTWKPAACEYIPFQNLSDDGDNIGVDDGCDGDDGGEDNI